MEILLPAGTEAQGQALSGFKGTDPADLDSLVTGQKEPRISRRRKPGSSLNSKKVVWVPRQPAKLSSLVGPLDLGGGGGVTRISFRPTLEFGVKFGDRREKDTHKKMTVAGRGERRI